MVDHSRNNDCLLNSDHSLRHTRAYTPTPAGKGLTQGPPGCSKISRLEGRAAGDSMRLIKTMRARLAATEEEGKAHAQLLGDRLADLERAQVDW